jgi:hypothetical protein
MRLQRVDQLVAHPLVHLGENVSSHEARQSRDQRSTLVTVRRLDEVGNVGRVQRLDQLARAFIVAGLDTLEHLTHEFGFSRSSSSSRSSRAGVSISLSLIALSLVPRPSSPRSVRPELVQGQSFSF